MCVCHCIGAPRSASECRCSWHNMYMCHELEMCVYRCMRPALGWEVFVTHILVTNSKFARCRISAPYALSHVSTFMWMCVVFVTQYVSICHETKCVCGGVMVPYALSHVSTFTWVRVVFVTQYMSICHELEMCVWRCHGTLRSLTRVYIHVSACGVRDTIYTFVANQTCVCISALRSPTHVYTHGSVYDVRDTIYIHLSRTQKVRVAVSFTWVWCPWHNIYTFITNSTCVCSGVSAPYTLSHVSTLTWVCVVFVTQYVSICHELTTRCIGTLRTLTRVYTHVRVWHVRDTINHIFVTKSKCECIYTHVRVDRCEK